MVTQHHNGNGVVDDSQDLVTCNSAPEAFDHFHKSDDLNTTLYYFRQICDLIGSDSTNIQLFYPKIKSNLQSWKAKSLWKQFDKKFNQNYKIYNAGKACKDLRVLIIGAGPCGLRAAIEAQFLGAKVTVIEKRETFSRNNVLKLWPFSITDLKDLGAKQFYGKLGSGGIEHISIRRLQCILLKIALLLGVEVFEGTSYDDLVYPTDETTGWKAKFSPSDHVANQMEFDALISADGNKQSVRGFKGSVFRANLAIAITANFVNRQSNADAKAEEISGVSAIYRQELFKKLKTDTGIDLENIVYYKDDTHYFVMTAKKKSLLDKGVIIQDTADTENLLQPSNVNQRKLIEYAKEAALYVTKNQLPDLEFERNHEGKDDVAIFDFTNMWQAEDSCKMIERKGHRLLMGLIGDSLLEPFWPTGTGIARGFFSAFDTCWMLKQWKAGKMTPLEVMAERESLFKILPQMTVDNILKNYSNYSIEPASRYTNTNKGAVLVAEARSFLDTDDPSNVEMSSRDSFNVLGSLPKKSKKGDTLAKSKKGDSLAKAKKGDTLAKTTNTTNTKKRDSLGRPEKSTKSNSLLRTNIAKTTGSLWRLNKREKLDTIVPQDTLLTWCKNQVASYPGITVNNMTSSFKDGRVFCAIIHRYRPSLIDMESINSENVAENNDKAFGILENEFGIKPEMSGKDLANSAVPNSLKMMSYVSKVYNKLRGEKPAIPDSKMTNAKKMPMVTAPVIVNEAKVTTFEIQEPIPLEPDEADKITSYKPTYIMLHFIQLVVSLGAIVILFIYHGVLEFTVDCEDSGITNNYTVKADIGYPLSLDSINPPQSLCHGNIDILNLRGNYSLYCQIFVGVGFLSSVTALFMFLKDLLAPRKVALLRRGCMFYLEVVVSVVFLVSWVVSSAVLVLTVLGYAGDIQFDVIEELNASICIAYKCHPGQIPDILMLWISVGLGWLCMVLYLLNVIFLTMEKRRPESDTSSQNSEAGETTLLQQ
ncbi:unnamed protein product [Meganyctiphanes norvegica]|uniref:Calponin-homology (CH) domain-containing protein n=1 Tax=Meganyctiphanes norvegica TaxID=48144 RepID=A0AAV2QJV4_MEGNR